MGSDECSDEQPIHQVTLDAYSICKTPVTVGQYQRFCAATARPMPPAPDFNANWRQQDHPIVNVSWEDAAAYCEWLSGETRMRVALPTEAQWEKAARYTDGRVYPWGNEWDALRLHCVRRSQDGVRGTAPVGSYSLGVSRYGVQDMAGNVWEWCQDWYDARYYANSPARNPQGPAYGHSRVIRGGCWSYEDPRPFRCAFRNRSLSTNRYDYLGFRCVVREDS